jgi:hypothetical protein
MESPWSGFAPSLLRWLPSPHWQQDSWHHGGDLLVVDGMGYVDVENGYWSLVIHQQSSPGVYLKKDLLNHRRPASSRDLARRQDADQMVQVGHLSGLSSCGSTEFSRRSSTARRRNNIRTLIPGSTTVYYKEGMYRQATTPTDIVDHTGFRTATDEGGL